MCSLPRAILESPLQAGWKSHVGSIHESTATKITEFYATGDSWVAPTNRMGYYVGSIHESTVMKINGYEATREGAFVSVLFI